MISTLESVAETIHLIENHHRAGNLRRGTPFVLPGDFDVDDWDPLAVLVAGLVQDARNQHSQVVIARATRWESRNELYDLGLLFAPAVRLRLGKSPQGAAVPNAVGREASDLRFLGWLHEIDAGWTAADLGLGDDPLTVADLTRIQFKAKVTTLDGQIQDLGTKFSLFQETCRKRDKGIRDAIDRMLQYQDAARIYLRAYPDLVESIPNIFEQYEAGVMPVILSAIWSPADLAALLTWTEITLDNFSRVQVRACPGAVAPTLESTLVETITDKAQTSYTAGAMFTPDAPTWSFRLWLYNTAGRMAASNWVTVSRA